MVVQAGILGTLSSSQRGAQGRRLLGSPPPVRRWQETYQPNALVAKQEDTVVGYKGEDRLPDFSAGVVRFEYRHEPYARATLATAAGGAETRDVKVQARTGDSRWLLITFDNDGAVHSFWIPARDAVRIRREESAWQDPYDLA